MRTLSVLLLWTSLVWGQTKVTHQHGVHVFPDAIQTGTVTGDVVGNVTGNVTGTINGPLFDNGGAVVNVKEVAYGARGDNITDDSVAIQAALDAAGTGGHVVFPVGFYRANNLQVQQGQTIEGAGVCDITLGLNCGTIIQPLSAVGGLTVFLSKNQAAGCKHGSSGTPKCADSVVFRDMVVEANGTGDMVFDLTNMNETVLDHVGVFGRLLSAVTGQIGINVVALNNSGSPTGGLDTRIFASKIFNLSTGVKISFGNATFVGPGNHIIGNTTGIEIDGQCTGGTCTTGGALNACLVNADCTSCGGTCTNNNNQGSLENIIFDNIIEAPGLAATNILNVGALNVIHGNRMENGSGACIQIDERGINTAITDNSLSNNAACTASVQLSNSATGPVATRVVIRDNAFQGSGKYVNEANASTAIEVGRNLYGGAGAKVTTVAASGVRWTDTVEGTTLAGITGAPINNIIGNGTMVYCTDCTIANPCAGGGTGAFLKRINGVNVCN